MFKKSINSSNKHFKILEWILYFILFLFSIICTWGVFKKFDSQTTSIGQKEEPISNRPTLTVCFSDRQIWEYGKDFNFSYNKVDGLAGDLNPLLIGKNTHEPSEEHIYLEEIFTIYSAICYKISAHFHKDRLQNVYTQIQIISHYDLPSLDIYFTSEEGSYGVTTSIWMDGAVMKIELPARMYKTVDVKVVKHINMEFKFHCNDKAFYECFAAKLSDADFSSCPKTCLPISTPTISPKIDIPFCKCEVWHQCEEYKCSKNIIQNLLNDIMADQDECPNSCSTYEYSGRTTYENEDQYDNKKALLEYRFSSPAFMKVHQEYLVFDTLGMISAVGGTLGLFIGFSFSKIMSFILAEIQILTTRFQRSSRRN